MKPLSPEKSDFFDTLNCTVRTDNPATHKEERCGIYSKKRKR